MNKKKSKALAFLLAASLLVPTANGTIYAATDLQSKGSSHVQQMQEKETNQVESQYVAMIEKQGYKTLQEAFNAVPADGKQVRIVMQKDIKDMKTADIATLEKGKNVVLDMNGKSITVASDFNGRPIVNEGTMVVTGEGIISSNKSESSGKGAIKNSGNLTIKNGIFEGNTKAVGSGAIYNNTANANLNIENGTFRNAIYALYNEGTARIYGGDFIGETCANENCNGENYGYTISNNTIDAKIYIYNANVKGVQGAVAINAGEGEIYNGNFETVPCKVHTDGSTANYALYVAGGSGKSKCTVYGGTFTATTKSAACIGNANKVNNDGGLRQPASVKIKGGTFIGGSDNKDLKNSIHIDLRENDSSEVVGSLEVSGGTFKKKDGTLSSEITMEDKNGSDVTTFNDYVEKNENGEALFEVKDGVVSKTDNNPTKGYIAKEVAEVKPTCTSEGHIKYYTCAELSGEYFKDANLSEKISLASTILPKLPHVFGEWTVNGEIKTRKCDTCDLTESMASGVAFVDGKAYETLEDAIKAAMAGQDKTVKLLSDIKVDTWNQIWNIKGITLDGNGKTIKVNKRVESNGNHDAILHSDGGNTFKNIKIDLSTVTERSNIEGIRAIDAGDGDVIDNVTIIGGEKISYGITAGSSCKNLTVKNSNISNCGHGVYLEGANDTTVLIKDNTFDACDYATILYSKNSTFEGNTVKGGKINIMHESNVVQKNTFMKDDKGNASRVKFYTEGNDKTYKYNKVEGVKAGEVGVTVEFGGGVKPENIDLSLNNWGRGTPSKNALMPGANIDDAVFKDILGRTFEYPEQLDNYLDETPSIPSKPIKPTYDHTSIIGSDRYDTAAKIADKLGSYDNVVLVNATSTMSDGLSASGLAGKEDSAILLTKKDSIPKVTMDRIRKVKKVYIIGGEAAISAKVANQITAAGIKIERIGGKNRVETSELVAKKIGNYKKAFVVNGFKGEADAMSASSVAAREEAPILLTNGKTSTHAKKSGVSYYVVGGNNVVNKSIANKYNAEVLAGRDRYATNREVIAEFYGASETLYFANGETLVDALTASTIAKDKGLVLVGRNSDNDVLNKKNTIQVGGMNFYVDFEK